MNKQQEIQAFHAFVSSLPEASYIRPWLTSIAVEVESVIRRDYPIELSPLRAEIEARGIIDAAKVEASRIVERAKEEAGKLKSRAHDDIASFRFAARQHLASLADRI